VAARPVAAATVDVDDLTVEFVRSSYSVKPLDGFCVRVGAGTLALLLGPSGCGKTTLLSCLAGILRPTSGTIRVGDTDVTQLNGGALTAYRRDRVGIVFQAFNLVPSLDATENVMVPMRAAGVKRSEARARATELLAHVGLADRAKHRPGTLSGGQQQRVGIARALALDPPLLIADEPTASLDHVQVENVLRILRALADEGRTVIVSTHDPRLLGLADQVVEMAPATGPASATPVVHELAAGEVLFREGARSERIYVVESGEIALTRALPGVDEEVLLATSAAGDAFGEMGAVFSLPRSATATAVGPARVVGYTVNDFKSRFGVKRLTSLIARVAAIEQGRS
jgi:putative ABC transport system ATP-binding protein